MNVGHVDRSFNFFFKREARGLDYRSLHFMWHLWFFLVLAHLFQTYPVAQCNTSTGWTWPTGLSVCDPRCRWSLKLLSALDPVILRGTISSGEWRFLFYLRKWGWEESELEEEDGGFESKECALQFGVWMASLGRGHSVYDSQHMFCVFVIAGVGICWKSLWYSLSAQRPRTNASSQHLKPLVNICTFSLLQWKEIFSVDYTMWFSGKHTVFSIIEGKGGH